MPSGSHYLLTNRNRRRRRMLLNQSHLSDQFESVQFDSSDVPKRRPQVDLSANIPHLGELLSEPAPLNWLVIGDSLLTPAYEGHTPTGFTEVFEKHLHGPLWRNDDVVTNGTAPRFLMSGAVEQLEFHLWRQRPDVILLLCGQADAEAGVKHCEEFERSLLNFILKVKQAGLNVIMNTPPCLPEADESVLVDRLVYIEAIKAASAEEDVPLVDHWQHWEWAAVEVGGTEAWYQSDLQHPGVKGFEQMTQLLFKECGLRPIQVDS